MVRPEQRARAIKRERVVRIPDSPAAVNPL